MLSKLLKEFNTQSFSSASYPSRRSLTSRVESLRRTAALHSGKSCPALVVSSNYSVLDFSLKWRETSLENSAWERKHFSLSLFFFFNSQHQNWTVISSRRNNKHRWLNNELAQVLHTDICNVLTGWNCTWNFFVELSSFDNFEYFLASKRKFNQTHDAKRNPEAHLHWECREFAMWMQYNVYDSAV